MTKVVPPDAFTINLKMTYNDVQAMRDRVKRMWASSSGMEDWKLLDDLESYLESLSVKLRERLDND